MKIKEVQLICEQCKGIYHVDGKRTLKTTRYCSRKCFDESRKGINNPVHRIKDRELVNRNISLGLLKSDKWKLTEKGRKSLIKSRTGKIASEQTKEKCRINALNTLEKLRNNNKVSKIEKIVELLLIKNDIKFISQKRLINITKADFYLPDKKLVIYCDGDYWHNLPNYIERDKRITKKLLDNGYKVLRFWEKDINSTKGQCVIDALINV
jgi:very-short-patch-repair endonuclease